MEYNEQEALNKVVAHARAQGEKALGVRASLVGCPIVEEVYRSELEGVSPFSATFNDALQASGIQVDPSFVAALKQIHDTKKLSEREFWLRGLANSFDLTYPEAT